MLKHLTSRLIGNLHERRAEKYLCQRGLRLIKRNFLCKVGEIDLIMLDGKSLAFIEVRFRNNDEHGNAAETVTRSKQQKIIKTAGYFLSQHRQYQHSDCRFDIVAISHNGTEIHWLKNAFME